MILNPRTRQEWQTAVDAAFALEALDAARAYGLLTGGPIVNLDRCEEILRQGKRLGILPRKEQAIQQLAAELVGT